MNYGVITYKQYDENVMLDNHFKVEELFRIILTDQDFIKFEIFDKDKNVLMSTHYPTVNDFSKYIHVARVKREEEIIGTTYNAYASPSLTHKTKVIWKVDGGICATKKHALNHADKLNRKMIRLIEKHIVFNQNK